MDKNVLEFRRTVQGNILKAFGGDELQKAVYVDNAQNRKLGRVGKEYGGKKNNIQDTKHKDKSTKRNKPKIRQKVIDNYWRFFTTAERDKDNHNISYNAWQSLYKLQKEKPESWKMNLSEIEALKKKVKETPESEFGFTPHKSPWGGYFGKDSLLHELDFDEQELKRAARKKNKAKKKEKFEDNSSAISTKVDFYIKKLVNSYAPQGKSSGSHKAIFNEAKRMGTDVADNVKAVFKEYHKKTGKNLPMNGKTMSIILDGDGERYSSEDVLGEDNGEILINLPAYSKVNEGIQDIANFLDKQKQSGWPSDKEYD